MRRLSLNRSRSRPKSGQNIPKNRGRTTIPERMVETLPGLPFIGDQVVCLSHDQAARSGPASMTPVGFRPRKPDALVRRGVGAAKRPRLMGRWRQTYRTRAVPAASGMFRKSRAFLPRYQKFESISLQRRDAMGRAARMAISSLTSIYGVPRCPSRTI